MNFKDLKVNFGTIGFRFDSSPDCVALPLLMKNALEGGPAVSQFYQEGYSDKAFEMLVKKAQELNGRKVHENFTSATESMIYVWEDAFLEISVSKSKMVSINAVSANDAITSACKEAASLFSSPVKTGYIFAITRGGNGLNISRVGYAGKKIEKNNYTEEVCKDYDFIIDDLRSKDPMGRIIILDGPPGTGKTSMIRGIFMDVTNAMFVIVPSNM